VGAVVAADGATASLAPRARALDTACEKQETGDGRGGEIRGREMDDEADAAPPLAGFGLGALTGVLGVAAEGAWDGIRIGQ